MATQWTSPEVYPYQLVRHVDAKAETLPDDPGADYEGACELFRITYGPRSEPRYDIICRGKCEDAQFCTLDVNRDRVGGPQYSASTYTFTCKCPEPKQSALSQQLKNHEVRLERIESQLFRLLKTLESRSSAE